MAFEWLSGVLSVLGLGGPNNPIGGSVSVPFGGPTPTPAAIPSLKQPAAATAARGWSKSIEDCHDALQRAWPDVKADWERMHPGYTLKLDYTWRSPAFQFELFKKGRALQDGQWVVVNKAEVVTEKDGTKPSHHNVYPSQALDAYIVGPDGHIIWTDGALYTEYGKLWERYGLIAGATWKYSWKDQPHVQVAYSIV